MNKYDAVKKMQEYIRDHLYENVSLSDLSTVSYYSPWHSYRLFTELTGLSPSHYIRRLRLSLSALKLRDFNVRILDVALDSGYASVDGYQRAFFKEFGVNPYEYSRKPTPIGLFIPYPVSERKEKKKMSEIKSVFVSVITKPKRKVILKRGIRAEHYFDYCAEVGCDVWGILKSICPASEEPVCLYLPKKMIRKGTSRYDQGVEVEENYGGPVPEGFDLIDLDEAVYLMFQGEPFEEENYGEPIENVQAAMNRYNPAGLGYRWDFENPRIQLEPIGSRGYIELKPVRKIGSDGR